MPADSEPRRKQHPRRSPLRELRERFSYLVESWGSSKPGKHTLQRQVQALFSTVATVTGYPNSPEQLLEESLIGYFVPFRSPRVADLTATKESFEFAKKLWSGLLKRCRAGAGYLHRQGNGEQR